MINLSTRPIQKSAQIQSINVHYKKFSLKPTVWQAMIYIQEELVHHVYVTGIHENGMSEKGMLSFPKRELQEFLKQHVKKTFTS